MLIIGSCLLVSEQNSVLVTMEFGIMLSPWVYWAGKSFQPFLGGQDWQEKWAQSFSGRCEPYEESFEKKSHSMSIFKVRPGL